MLSHVEVANNQYVSYLPGALTQLEDFLSLEREGRIDVAVGQQGWEGQHVLAVFGKMADWRAFGPALAKEKYAFDHFTRGDLHIGRTKEDVRVIDVIRLGESDLPQDGQIEAVKEIVRSINPEFLDRIVNVVLPDAIKPFGFYNRETKYFAPAAGGALIYWGTSLPVEQ